MLVFGDVPMPDELTGPVGVKISVHVITLDPHVIADFVEARRAHRVILSHF